MSECRDLKERMHEAMDGELPAAQRQTLMEHIARCKDCEATWRLLSAADGLLAGAQMAAPATGFAARVRVRAEMRQQSRRTRLGWLAVCLATLLVATVAGVLSVGWVRDSIGSLAPSSWLSHAPAVPVQFLGVLGSLVKGMWLFVRGLVAYANVNWLLLVVAALSVATGFWFVTSHLVGASMTPSRRSSVAMREGI